MVRMYAIGSALGANLAGIVAGVAGNGMRALAWMMIAALFTIAASRREAR